PDADVKVVDLLRAGEGRVIGGDGHLFVVDDVVDRVHHVIGGKRVAVLERHALAQGEVDRGGIDLLPRCGQGRLDLHGYGIAIHQTIESMEGHDHAGALRIIVRVDIGNGVAPGDA